MVETEARLDLPPLPSAVRDAVLRAFGDGGPLTATMNPGLVFERFPRCWERSAGTWALGPRKKEFLTELAAGYRHLEQSFKPLLDARIQVLDRHLPGSRTYEARWRFVTGVGAEHPVENGFSFHPLLGVPYFPGSTVKGLVRVAARLSGIAEAEERRLFGSTAGGDDPETGSEQAGALVFLDALPVDWPTLGVDLINNHRPTWTALINSGLTGVDLEGVDRQQRASAAGLEDPVPVYFLVVEPRVRLRFWMTVRSGSSDASHDLEQAWDWLEVGLRYLGIGAKTAVGYGRFGSETSEPAPRSRAPAAAPRLKKGDRVRFVLTKQSKKGKWQGHLADDPDSFGTLLGDPPADAAIGRSYEVIVGAAGDLENLNLRWP